MHMKGGYQKRNLQPLSLVTTSGEFFNDETWYTDNGASSHIKLYLANLFITNEYHEKDNY